MLDIAWSELLLIAVVALIFIGPKELPGMLHTLGRFVRKIRNHADDFRRQFDDSMREGGYQDLQKNLHDFRALNPAGQLKDSIKRAIEHDYSKPAQAPEQPQGGAPQGADAAKTANEVDGQSTTPPPAASAAAPAAIPPAQVDSAPPLTFAESAPVPKAVVSEKPSAEPTAAASAPVNQAIPAKPLEPQAAASDPAKDRIAPAA
ncbi:Sec-independent protein translocase protein TatB [Rhodomicrobium sp. Az07]|uniref:Sec-independent protein translocase protein TatB n=1 Tax=Rhodomicrobium sp. Az07 TaxID=2839034 RepID=UPI001BECB60D|nr:Sec-independent protein translocase protein TatB [Rhodomicrobium sp. Az07]MBT3071284.1 Sec-independent protein translocase protein TatB [Rhodomicrobium sp. Az07]